MVSGVPGGIGSGLNRLGNHDRIVAFFEKTAPVVAEHGFQGFVGQEFIPKRSDPLVALRQGVMICDV